MTAGCSDYRTRIPRALLEELDSGEQQALEAHLAECPNCAREQAQYAGTLEQLRSVSDVPTPRHFFVYPEERRLNAWQLFGELSFGWKTTVGVTILSLSLLCGFLATRMQVRAEDGVYSVSFGRPAESHRLPSPPSLDVAALKGEILRAVDESYREENRVLAQILRAELAQSNRRLGERQRELLQTALGDLEARVGDRIVTTASTLEEGAEKSMADLYRAVASQRDRDLAEINNRMSRIAVSGEIKNNQTDAILETLLQVAEFRLK